MAQLLAQLDIIFSVCKVNCFCFTHTQTYTHITRLHIINIYNKHIYIQNLFDMHTHRYPYIYIMWIEYDMIIIELCVGTIYYTRKLAAVMET